MLNIALTIEVELVHTLEFSFVSFPFNTHSLFIFAL